MVAVDRTITFAGLPLFLLGGGDGDGVGDLGVNTILGDLTEGGVGGVGGGGVNTRLSDLTKDGAGVDAIT